MEMIIDVYSFTLPVQKLYKPSCFSLQHVKHGHQQRIVQQLEGYLHSAERDTHKGSENVKNYVDITNN